DVRAAQGRRHHAVLDDQPWADDVDVLSRSGREPDRAAGGQLPERRGAARVVPQRCVRAEPDRRELRSGRARTEGRGRRAGRGAGAAGGLAATYFGLRMQTRMSTHGFTWRAQILLLLLAVAPVDAEIVGSRVVRFPWTSFVQRVDGAVYVTALRFDSAGNVVVAATLDDVISSELMVASFAREDGTLRWVYRLPEHPGTENFVYDAAVDKRGDVVLSGFTDGVEEVPEVGTRFAAI